MIVSGTTAYRLRAGRLWWEDTSAPFEEPLEVRGDFAVLHDGASIVRHGPLERARGELRRFMAEGTGPFSPNGFPVWSLGPRRSLHLFTIPARDVPHLSDEDVEVLNAAVCARCPVSRLGEIMEGRTEIVWDPENDAVLRS